MTGPGPLRRGDKIAPHLTVVGLLDGGGSDPVYIVWHHGAWTAMCCKLFEEPAQARWEAKALSALAHPGIVRLLEDGAPRYVCMEFLEGPSLHDLLGSRPRRRLGVSDALRVAVHLGSALAHLHGRGYLHLDVKPGNVIVTGRRPVLFDLGTARRADGRPLSHPQGTDAYMAPEQCRRGGVPTPASDVWGLGVTLFEMLTGERPFPERGDGDDAPFSQVGTTARRLREVLPRAARGLEEAVAWCLAPEPADRPRSMAELLPILNGHIRGGPRMWPRGLDPTGAGHPTSALSHPPGQRPGLDRRHRLAEIPDQLGEAGDRDRHRGQADLLGRDQLREDDHGGELQACQPSTVRTPRAATTARSGRGAYRLGSSASARAVRQLAHAATSRLANSRST